MVTGKLERERESMIPHRPCFNGVCGRGNHNEEVLHWVLDQGGRGAGVLAIDMTGVEVVAMDIVVKGVQSAVNETADEENK